MDKLYLLISTIPHEADKIRARQMVEHWVGGPDTVPSPRTSHDMAIGILNLMSLDAFNWHSNYTPPPMKNCIFYTISLMHTIPLAISIFVAYAFPGMRSESFTLCYQYFRCKFYLIDDDAAIPAPQKLRDIIESMYWTVIRRVSAFVNLYEPLPEMIPFPFRNAIQCETRRMFNRYIHTHQLDICTKFATTPRFDF